MMQLRRNNLQDAHSTAGNERRLTGRVLRAVGIVPRHTPIGCVIADRTIRLIQLRPGDRLLLSARANIEGTSSDNGCDRRRQVAAALREALAGAPFIGRHVVTCLPAEQVEYRRLLMVPMPDEELAQSIYWQIAKEIGHEPSDQCIDYFDAGKTVSQGKIRREVIAVSASANDLHGHLFPLQDVGLVPFAVDTISGALARCLSIPSSPGHPERSGLVMNLGSLSSTLIVTQSACPHFVYALPQVKFAPEMDDGDRRLMTSDLAHGIKVCAHYLEERDGGTLLPEYGCVAGAGEWELDVVNELCSASPIPFRLIVDSISPGLRLQLSQLPASFTIDEFLIPLGLALYGCERSYLEAAA